MLVLSVDELEETVKIATASHISLAIHAIGIELFAAHWTVSQDQRSKLIFLIRFGARDTMHRDS
jgi:hypothetical protein